MNSYVIFRIWGIDVLAKHPTLLQSTLDGIPIYAAARAGTRPAVATVQFKRASHLGLPLSASGAAAADHDKTEQGRS